MLERTRLRPGRGFKPFRAALYYAQRSIVQPTIRSAITAGFAAPITLCGASHQTRLELLWRAHEAQTLMKAVGYGAVRVVTGEAGTAFLADTIGIHAGPIPISRPRLMLQVGYTLLPRFSLLYRPAEIESRPVVDKYINRLFIRS